VRWMVVRSFLFFSFRIFLKSMYKLHKHK
jgi:hypothetical protein